MLPRVHVPKTEEGPLDEGQTPRSAETFHIPSVT